MQLYQYSIEHALRQFVFFDRVITDKAYCDEDEQTEVGILQAGLELTRQL